MYNSLESTQRVTHNLEMDAADIDGVLFSLFRVQAVETQHSILLLTPFHEARNHLTWLDIFRRNSLHKHQREDMQREECSPTLWVTSFKGLCVPMCPS